MINLIKVNEIGDDLIQEFKLSKEDQLYECQLDNIKIGYAIIRNEKNNKIFMVLAEKYQNNVKKFYFLNLGFLFQFQQMHHQEFCQFQEIL